MDLRLRPVRESDEAAFRAAHVSLWDTDGFAFGLNYDPEEPFAAFVERHRDFARGINLPPGLVPATFLIAVVEGEIVGRASIRHDLNEFLRTDGGHIGYGVLEDHRRNGYATEILRQSLIVARSLGLDSALLICAEDNVGSRTVIERCGGELANVGTGYEGDAIRRYHITL